MDKEDFEPDEFDEIMDWMVKVYQTNTFDDRDSQGTSSTDLKNYEVGLKGSRLVYVTDGNKWHWF
jgi:hypothetical protein